MEEQIDTVIQYYELNFRLYGNGILYTAICNLDQRNIKRYDWLHTADELSSIILSKFHINLQIISITIQQIYCNIEIKFLRDD